MGRMVSSVATTCEARTPLRHQMVERLGQIRHIATPNRLRGA